MSEKEDSETNVPIATSKNNEDDGFRSEAHSEGPLGHFYGLLMSKSTVFGFGARVAEKCLSYATVPLTLGMQAPHAVAYAILDSAKSRCPVIVEKTSAVVESGRTAVLRSSLTHKTLTSMDYVLGVVEAVVTLVPQVSVYDGSGTRSSTLVSKALLPVRVCYSVVTWPLRCTTNVIGMQRRFIDCIVNSSAPEEEDADARIRNRRKVSPRKRLVHKTFVQRFFSLPRRLLAIVGQTTHERNERIFATEVDSASATEANVSTLSTEEKKRKYDCIQSDADVDENEASDDGDDDVSLAVLQTTLSDYSSVNDPDYVPEEVDVSEHSNSLEYHSGSVQDDAVEQVEKEDVEEDAVEVEKEEDAEEDAVEVEKEEDAEEDAVEVEKEEDAEEDAVERTSTVLSSSRVEEPIYGEEEARVEVAIVKNGTEGEVAQEGV